MNAVQQLIAALGTALVAAAVVGCIARARYRAWWFFFLYLLTVLASDSLVLAAPARFHTPEFWRAKETAITALRFAMACEVGVRTMRSFPGALTTARRMVLLILAVTLAALVSQPPPAQFTGFVGDLLPRVLNGSAWMMMAIAGLILWYRLPVRPFHKAILLSYLPYMFVFMILVSYIGQFGWGSTDLTQYVYQLAYVALLAYWNYAIWRREDSPRPEKPAAALNLSESPPAAGHA